MKLEHFLSSHWPPLLPHVIGNCGHANVCINWTRSALSWQSQWGRMQLGAAPCRQQNSSMVDVLYYANEKLTGMVQRLLLDRIVAMIYISCVCGNPTNASLLCMLLLFLYWVATKISIPLPCLILLSYISHMLLHQLCWLAGSYVASFPGPTRPKKKGLVSTVCACA